jgi:hypothetical protein
MHVVCLLRIFLAFLGLSQNDQFTTFAAFYTTKTTTHIQGIVSIDLLNLRSHGALACIMALPLPLFSLPQKGWKMTLIT